MSVEQIDVVRGPATLLYGPNAIGGLVNMITDRIPSVSARRVTGTLAVESNSVNDEISGHFRTVVSGAHSAVGFSAGGLHAGDTATWKKPGS